MAENVLSVCRVLKHAKITSLKECKWDFNIFTFFQEALVSLHCALMMLIYGSDVAGMELFLHTPKNFVKIFTLPYLP